MNKKKPAGDWLLHNSRKIATQVPEGLSRLLDVLNLSGILVQTLVKKSDIAYIKSKFFLIRALSYSSFLLIPVWVQKSLDLNRGAQALMMLLYIVFVTGQWFLLGKEIDYRFKIYFRVNSSMDRLMYRLLTGMVGMIMLFNIFSLLPSSVIHHFFWGTWVLLGLYYSWPTRGKIIRESVSTQLGEFKFLDSFEKTLLFLCTLLFIVSVPELPSLNNAEALKLYFDPSEKISPQYWNFISFMYFPFRKFPELTKLAWCLHFYVVGLGLFLLAFYALLRFFVSRRLSVLGVFALLSSWSFSKILARDYGLSLSTTYSVMWVWAGLWVAKSATYRTGLFMGFIGYLGVILNQSYFFLIPLHAAILNFYFLKNKNFWFKKQLLKYFSFGAVMSLFTIMLSENIFEASNTLNFSTYLPMIKKMFERKAFYTLSAFGFLGIMMRYIFKKADFLGVFKIDDEKVFQLIASYFLLFLSAFFLDADLVEYFSAMWIIVFFSLIPLECLFQATSRFRSRRNVIYVIYILICLLDSHVEGRFKIFMKLFSDN